MASPFKISIDIVEKLSSLSPGDIGKWACLIRGTIQVLHGVKSMEEAVESARFINRSRYNSRLNELD